MFPFTEASQGAARLALAIDALCVGTPWPILVHGCSEGRPPGAIGALGLYCTPLDELSTLDAVTTVLEQVTRPVGWRIAGVCSPTTIRATRRIGSHPTAWFVHVVTAGGDRASRLCVPDELSLSGPTTPGVAVDRLDRCLRRLVTPDPRSHPDGSEHP